jgi:thiamine-phosphate pyrophosphorylase
MRRKLDLSVYFVTDPALCIGRGVVATALAAAAGGATVVQLRDPDAKGRSLLETARALVAALKPHGIPVIVNDRIDIALAAGADGAHVGQQDMPVADARALLGPNAILGLSTTNRAQVLAAPVADLDYLGCGPVYGAGVKTDANPVIGLGGLREAVVESRLPVVAIGGIAISGAKACIEAGAAGVAVVTAIAAAPDAAEAARALRTAVDTGRKSRGRA